MLPTHQVAQVRMKKKNKKKKTIFFFIADVESSKSNVSNSYFEIDENYAKLIDPFKELHEKAKHISYLKKKKNSKERINGFKIDSINFKRNMIN